MKLSHVLLILVSVALTRLWDYYFSEDQIVYVNLQFRTSPEVYLREVERIPVLDVEYY